MPRSHFAALGTAGLLLTVIQACQMPQMPVIGLPSPAAATVKDKALMPMASVMVMSAQAMGQMAGSGSQAMGAIAAIPFRAAMTVLQASPSPSPSPTPFALPAGIPSNLAALIPGYTGGSLPPIAIPSGLASGFNQPFPIAVPSTMPWKQFWDWRDGWYWSKFNAGDRQLRFRFEDASGTPADVDVMDMTLYGMPPKMTGFPSRLVKFHTEFANSYALGVKVTATLYGDIPPAPPTAETRIPQKGTGTVSGVPAVGDIAFTVDADANGAGNDVTGKVVHTVSYGGATYTGESGLNLNGMVPPGTIKRDGATVAELKQGATAGQWEMVVDGQTVPVDATGIGLAI
jgi:hypothetical protein